MIKKLSGCCGPDGMPAADFGPELKVKADLFKALGDEVRLKVLHLVQGQEICVCDLVPLLGVAQSTLSHHLGILLQAGLVSARKEGRWNHYQATDKAKQALYVFTNPSIPAPSIQA